MATDVIDVTDYDDEVTVLFSTPAKGTSKKTAICVENYRTIRRNRVIDLTRNLSHFNDEVEVIYSLPIINMKKFLRGESSNTKSATVTESKSVPLVSMCEICADEKLNTEMFHILGCSHYYCSDCMSKYVASKLHDNITKITCPVSGCAGYLEPHHCRSILPKQVFDRWGDALCEAVILSSEKFYCPYKDCSALLIIEGSDEVIGKSECPYCNRLFCVQCKVSWHGGITCAEFGKLTKDERNSEDLMLMSLAKSKNWQRCPKCRFYVERIDGCLFMKCRCGYSFCYHCTAPLKAHYCNNCKR